MNAHSVVNSVDESANAVPNLLTIRSAGVSPGRLSSWHRAGRPHSDVDYAAMKNADVIALNDTDLLLDEPGLLAAPRPNRCACCTST